MACESSWRDYLSALDALADCAARLREYAERVGQRLPEEPALLMNGEVNSWRRFAEEAEAAADKHRSALAAYLDDAMRHGSAEAATPEGRDAQHA